MSYSSHFLKAIMSMILLMMITITSFSERSMAKEEEEGESNNNHIYELSSREEMAKLAGYGEEKLSNVIITGSLLCQSCSHGEREIRTWPLSGALVTINCNRIGKKTKRHNLVKAVTDEYGDFHIDLPSHLHGIPNLHKRCSVNAHRIPKSSACHPAFATNQKMLTLTSAKNGNRIYTAGGSSFCIPIHYHCIIALTEEAAIKSGTMHSSKANKRGLGLKLITQDGASVNNNELQGFSPFFQF